MVFARSWGWSPDVPLPDPGSGVHSSLSLSMGYVLFHGD